MGKTSKMQHAPILIALVVLSCGMMQGAQPGFDEIVRVISDQLHVRPLHIPFFGLVNFATFVAHPAGVKHLNLAVFENLALDDGTSKDLAKAIGSTDGGWRPFVQIHSHAETGHAETVLIYMAEDRRDCRLLIASIENSDVTVVELKLNPAAIAGWLREPHASAARTVSR